MTITRERLRQTFSEGGAQEIYHEVRAEGDFLGFAHRYVFDSDYRVARSALWGLTKASDEELSELHVILNELIDQAMQTKNSSVRRLTLNIIERLKMEEDDLRTDFLRTTCGRISLTSASSTWLASKSYLASRHFA